MSRFLHSLRFTCRAAVIHLAAPIVIVSLGAKAQEVQEPVYRNPSLPIVQRVDDLVGRMTLAEKVSQMRNNAVAIPRFDIPDYEWCSEGLHGVARAGHATVFPQAIGMAAT